MDLLSSIFYLKNLRQHNYLNFSDLSELTKVFFHCLLIEKEEGFIFGFFPSPTWNYLLICQMFF